MRGRGLSTLGCGLALQLHHYLEVQESVGSIGDYIGDYTGFRV